MTSGGSQGPGQNGCLTPKGTPKALTAQIPALKRMVYMIANIPRFGPAWRRRMVDVVFVWEFMIPSSYCEATRAPRKSPYGSRKESFYYRMISLCNNRFA